MKRCILDINAGYQNDVSGVIDLSKINIKRLWTLYDEQLVLTTATYNPHTGELVTDLYNAHLQHNNGVFLEDRGHDWKIRNNKLDYYSRVVKQNTPVKILVEYEEVE
jgi:hypothetical protein